MLGNFFPCTHPVNQLSFSAASSSIQAWRVEGICYSRHCKRGMNCTRSKLVVLSKHWCFSLPAQGSGPAPATLAGPRDGDALGLCQLWGHSRSSVATQPFWSMAFSSIQGAEEVGLSLNSALCSINILPVVYFPFFLSFSHASACSLLCPGVLLHMLCEMSPSILQT